MRLAQRAALACLAAAMFLAIAGCGSRVIDLRDPPDPDPLPAASSPDNALLRLQWAWNHRDPAPLDDLFTADYVFQSVATDTTTPEAPSLFRDSELEFSKRLFRTGSPTLPAATAITMELGSPTLGPDGRGKPAPWHLQIATDLHVGVRVPGGDYRVMGGATFFFVRGDSAKIPQRLIDAGYRPDPDRWWIERWEDRTEPAAAAARASEPFTVTHLKSIYLDLGTR